MANYKTYTKDPITGETMETVSATPISAENLNPQTPIKLPDYPTDNTNYFGMINDSLITTPTTTQTESEPAWMKYLKDTPAPENPINTYNQLYSDSDIEGKTQNVIDAQKQLDLLNAQLKGITDQATKTNLQLEGGAESGRALNTTAQILTGEQQNINRQAAIKALPLQAQILSQQAVVTGNQNLLTAAKEKLNTTLQLQQAYQTQLYNYNKDIRDRIYQYATDEEKRKLDAQQKVEDRAYEEKQASLKNAQSIAKDAFDAGQSDIAAQITSLDPNSKTYTQDLAKLQAQIKNPAVELDRQLKQLQIAKAYKDLSETTTGKVVKVNVTDYIQNADGTFTLPNLPKNQNVDVSKNDTRINTIEELKKDNSGIGGAVGPNILGRLSFGTLTGQTQNFIGSVEQIIKELTLDNLINAKANGATFGALSDQELRLLSDSASKIGSWRITKDGQVVGYNIDMGSFKKELDRIEQLAQKDKNLKLEGLQVNSYLNNIDSALQGSNNPYSSYNLAPN